MRHALRVFVQLCAIGINASLLLTAMRAGVWLFALFALLELIWMAYTTWIHPIAVSTDWWGWGAAIFVLLFPLFSTDFLVVREGIPAWRAAAGNGLISCAFVLELGALAFLNTAFTQVPEARKLVNRGLYRYVRHPLYMAYFVAYFGQAFIFNEWLYWLTFAIFVISQTIRAKAEERVLSRTFPLYEEYQKQTGMFVPKGWIRNVVLLGVPSNASKRAKS